MASQLCFSRRAPRQHTCSWSWRGCWEESTGPWLGWAGSPPTLWVSWPPTRRHKVSSVPPVAQHWTHVGPHIIILGSKYFLASTWVLYPRLDWISFRKTNHWPFSSKEKGRRHQEFVISMSLGKPISYPLCLKSCSKGWNWGQNNDKKLNGVMIKVKKLLSITLKAEVIF